MTSRPVARYRYDIQLTLLSCCRIINRIIIEEPPLDRSHTRIPFQRPELTLISPPPAENRCSIGGMSDSWSTIFDRSLATTPPCAGQTWMISGRPASPAWCRYQHERAGWCIAARANRRRRSCPPLTEGDVSWNRKAPSTTGMPGRQKNN